MEGDPLEAADATVAVERVDVLHVGSAQLKVETVDVADEARARHRFRDHHHSALQLEARAVTKKERQYPTSPLIVDNIW